MRNVIVRHEMVLSPEVFMRTKMKNAILIAFLAIVFSENALGWRSFKIILTSFPHSFDSELLGMKAEIRNNTEGDTSVDVIINPKQEFNELELQVTVSMEGDNGNYTEVLNRSMDFCKFLQDRNSEPMLKVIYEDMLKHGNFVKECPVRKGVYSIKQYRLDEEMLPTYIPETNFFIEIKFSLPTTKKNLFKGRINGKIDKSKGFNNLKMFSMG